MIEFYRDKYGVTVFFGSNTNGNVRVNSDISMDLRHAMTFEEKVVSVKQMQNEIVSLGYTDGKTIITQAELDAMKEGISKDPGITEVEKEVRLEVIKRTWKPKTEDQQRWVDIPFVVIPLQNTDDYRLIPVRTARDEKASYFALRGRNDWLFPHIEQMMARFGLTKSTNHWNSEKNTYSLDHRSLKIEGQEVFSDAETKEIFLLDFTGTVEECQNRINSIIDLVEEKVYLWWKVRQKLDGVTIADALVALKRIGDRVRQLDVKKSGEGDKRYTMNSIDELVTKLVAYAKKLPNPTPEQIENDRLPSGTCS